MSVRKRSWTTPKGERRESWVVDYVDQGGKRHIETFARKGDATARHAEVSVDVRKGVHVAASKSITVLEAGERWLRAAEVDLERATVKTYREHVKHHITPLIGRMKLSGVTVPVVDSFKSSLREAGRSPALIQKILVSLGSIIAEAQVNGLTGHNAVRDLRRNAKRGKDRQAALRRKGRLEIGVDISTPDEVSVILYHAPARWRPLI